eukprot:CAMPEP_0195056692 /NCGR_PEP_ID=MMETSP0448-20130528/4977_1 /TAXON_ID=66468 /ORGANISM="Heterocapsa triquestra, Strain CCMP 448" /LENGTH=592 /DNA_ID=CAMNT_0040086533 /DNA_START=47 /DNA_END=1825 /DNA_ORIENTATION=+
MAQLWRVVGGGDKGGIVVREGSSISSSAFSERLSTGSKIRELTLKGDRLQYELLTGAGPQQGWVSIQLAGGKELVVKYEEENDSGAKVTEAASAPAATSKSGHEGAVPRALQPHKTIALKFAPTCHLDAFKPQVNVKKFKENAAKRLTGQFYGLEIPATPEEMASEAYGVKWLTKAFHKAGTLPTDNSVKSIVKWRRFTGGGSGPKCLFEVEYATPNDVSDTVLFAKFPWTLEENLQQKIVEQAHGKFGDNWGGEINFYRFVAPHVPFAVPALYFGDLNRESTEAIIINASVSWPAEGKTEFEPYELHQPCGKCEDYLLQSPQEHYFAMLKHQGHLAGLDKMGQLGSDQKSVQWMDYAPEKDVFCSFAMPGHEKMFRHVVENGKIPHLFPDGVRATSFLDKFEKQIVEISGDQPAISKYLYSNPVYVGFQHQNCNTDNAFFFRRPDGTMDCGLLDFGSFCHMAFATAFQGSFVSCLGTMLAEYDDRLVQCWADAYHATGAPKMDVEELVLQYRIASGLSVYGCIASARSLLDPGLNAFLQTAKAYTDEAIRGHFGLSFQLSMLINRAHLWALRGDAYYASYQKWVARGRKGP